MFAGGGLWWCSLPVRKKTESVDTDDSTWGLGDGETGQYPEGDARQEKAFCCLYVCASFLSFEKLKHTYIFIQKNKTVEIKDRSYCITLKMRKLIGLGGLKGFRFLNYGFNKDI